MVYKREYIEELARSDSGLVRLNEEIQNKRTLAAVVDKECPEFKMFLHKLNLDLDSAAKHLPAVLDGGCVEQYAEHITATKLIAGTTVWKLRLRCSGILGISGSGDSARTGECWHTVSLRFKIEPDKRRIDTEFFGWNEAIDCVHNATDDPEKFHIVWEWDNNYVKRTLAYAGFGTNQPYKLPHPHAFAFSSRPRFRVFDRDKGESYKYAVVWRNQKTFDWNWQYVAPEITTQSTTLTFVLLIDGSYLCLSDREVARATALSEHWKEWHEAFESAGALDRFQIWKTTVTIPIPQKLHGDAPDPSLLEFVRAPGRDYVAYFAALNASEVHCANASDVKKLTAPLGTARSGEYMERLCRPCAEVFLPDLSAYLPLSMGELFCAKTADMPPELAKAVKDWKANIEDELRKDLYYYGQDAIERMNRLRFAAWLALEDQFGSIYFKALDAAANTLRGQKCHGQYLAILA